MRPHYLTLLALALFAFGAGPSRAAPTDAELIKDVVAANRILYDQGVVDGFGHVSVRSAKDPTHFFMARSMAPGLVTEADIVEYNFDANAVDGSTKPAYLERFIHSEIYRVRPDVMAVVHSHSPAVIPFGVTGAELRPIYHMSSFLGGPVPIFDIHQAAGDTDLLIRNPTLGHALALTLGQHPVVLMRGHGSVAVGTSVQEVVFRAYYTEMNARLQAEALRLGPITFLTPEEAQLSAKTNAAIIPRAWELWKRKAMGGG
jgi:ribulose-5-phosphate 4-epimerase/fuculose-1-phosphate aldolase